MGGGGAGIERLEKVNEDGALDGGEVSVPDEMEGDVTLEDWTSMVLKDERLLSSERREFPRCGGGEFRKGGEVEEKSNEEGEIVSSRSHGRRW